MAPVAYVAFRYTGRFYRRSVENGASYRDSHNDANHQHLGQRLAGRIPRYPDVREEWIGYVKKRLDMSIGAPRDASSGEDKRGLSDAGSGTTSVARSGADRAIDDTVDEFWNASWGDLYEKPHFSDVLEDDVWLTSERNHWFTYVFDMDYRAFTIQGRYHFNMNNMPPIDTNIAGYLNEHETVSTAYKTSVSYWPRSTFDADDISAQYAEHGPRVSALHEWGAPTWESLSISQSLSVDFAKSLISDYCTVLANPRFSIDLGRVVMLCWRIVCAAAPSHLFYVAHRPERFKDIPRVSTRMFNWETLGPEFDSGGIRRDMFYTTLRLDLGREKKPLPRPYCWFRGCLIKFCLRLDEDIHVKAEVVQMVDRLKGSSHAGKVGIVISNYQLVVVAVDDMGVRHSPVLDFHDNKGGAKDGLLLLVHLLRPALTVCGSVWANPQAIPNHTSTRFLPEDVIRHILSFADEETYHFILPYVSRLVRAICLSRPRIGDYDILAANQDGSYRAYRTTGRVSEIQVRLSQKLRTSGRSLENSFVTQQAGIGEGNKDYWAQRKKLPWDQSSTIPWDELVRGDVAPTMRISVLEGIWSIKEVPA
ncbi:hypothetical protein RhiJN_16410 [Ceratobasidium sp. AG-Ba]|nr:hypothetical protein RhiJN_16410 [Ceratobasidium sp. AG-Ba]